MRARVSLASVASIRATAMPIISRCNTTIGSRVTAGEQQPSTRDRVRSESVDSSGDVIPHQYGLFLFSLSCRHTSYFEPVVNHVSLSLNHLRPHLCVYLSWFFILCEICDCRFLDCRCSFNIFATRCPGVPVPNCVQWMFSYVFKYRIIGLCAGLQVIRHRTLYVAYTDDG